MTYVKVSFVMIHGVADGRMLMGGVWCKPEFYPVQQTMSNGRGNVQYDLRSAVHLQPAAGGWDVLAIHFHRVRAICGLHYPLPRETHGRAFTGGAICDWVQWLQFFAFGVIGGLMFGNRLGFLETGTDVEGVIGGHLSIRL